MMTCCVAALSVVGLLAMASSAHAWCQSCTVVNPPTSCPQPCFCPTTTNPDAHFLFWDRPCIELAVEDDVGPMFTLSVLNDAIDNSFAQWTDVDCGGGRTPGFTIRRGSKGAECDFSEYVSGEGNANSIVFVHEGWEDRELHDRGAFALTTTFFFTASGQIIDADMELNEEWWDFAACGDEPCADGSVDLENTLTHEAGHFLGLAHTESDSTATMWACAEPGDVGKRSLEDDDIEGICTIYPADALAAECDFEPRGGFNPECAEERGCGCRVPGRAEPMSAGGGGSAAFAWRPSSPQKQKQKQKQKASLLEKKPL